MKSLNIAVTTLGQMTRDLLSLAHLSETGVGEMDCKPGTGWGMERGRKINTACEEIRVMQT